ncbi:MAG: hypothetical protein ACYCU5_06195 [Actinomycetes bacterium]
MTGEPLLDPDVSRARQMIRDVATFATDYQLPASRVRPDRVEMAMILWGWWHWTVAQARLIVRACDDGSALGAAPLVRSVAEHAHAMVWLRDAGDAGIAAVHLAFDASRALLHARLKEEGGDPAPLQPGPPPPDVDPETLRRERALFADVQQRVRAYKDADPYSIYGLLSNDVHASLATARAFAGQTPDGAAIPLNAPDVERESASRDAAPIHAATELLIAAQVLLTELDDPQLCDAIQQWAEMFGLLPAVPTRREDVTKDPSAKVGVQEAARLIVVGSDVSNVLAAAERVVNGELPAGVKRTDVQGALGRTLSALERIGGWAEGDWESGD